MNAVKKRVFISYCSHQQDLKVADAFYQALQTAGFDVFMAEKSIRLGDNWAHRVEQALNQCDFFLLLLSVSSAASEMVIEEVRHIKALYDKSDQGSPLILPVRLQYPLSQPLNYDLRSYLQRIQQGQWHGDDDTARIVAQIVALKQDLNKNPKLHPDAAPPLAPPQPLSSAQDTGTRPAEAVEQLDGTTANQLSSAMPSPMAEPELPDGAMVDLASAFYVERPPNEASCQQAIEQPGALIRIKAPRQMGKTSLMARILKHASDQGATIVPISFRMAEQQVFLSLDTLLRWLCAVISRRLQLPIKQLNDSWDPIFGSKDNCTAYFEAHILPGLHGSLVLALDEVDRIFAYPEVAEDFLALLRCWHEEGKSNALWRRLSLIVVHSTEVYIPMNINQSPFNVGLAIALPELTVPQLIDLATCHGLQWQAGQARDLIQLLGGHPYLARICLYHLSCNNIDWAQLVAGCATDQGPFGDHLKRLLWELEHNQLLGRAFCQVLAATAPLRLDSQSAFKLQSMGLVSLHGNDVQPRCDLYRWYFSDRLGPC